MTPLLAVLSVFGVAAVAAFLTYFVLGPRQGWESPMTRISLRMALGLSAACAVIGVLFAFTG